MKFIYSFLSQFECFNFQHAFIVDCCRVRGPEFGRAVNPIGLFKPGGDRLCPPDSKSYLTTQFCLSYTSNKILIWGGSWLSVWPDNNCFVKYLIRFLLTFARLRLGFRRWVEQTTQIIKYFLYFVNSFILMPAWNFSQFRHDGHLFGKLTADLTCAVHQQYLKFQTKVWLK